MKQGRGRYQKSDGWGFIYVPADVAKDSAFPFADKDTLTIKIVDRELRIEKVTR
jgi:hypothetical protein